ncbi:MAG: hypothetical protein K2Z81_15940 [Cyanobacteria bacterium]|nr:hypothetical protein [Cyanobacteriota bacterium]
MSVQTIEQESQDHLEPGDVFSIFGFNGENRFRLVKVVAIKNESVHLFVYGTTYPSRPSSHNVTQQLTIPTDVRLTRNMYLPVSRKLFGLMRPVHVGLKEVEDDELNGYRQWCLTGGEVAGNAFALDDEKDENWKIYAKIFLLTSVPFFLVFSFFYYFRIFGWIYDFEAAFKMSIAYGVAMIVLQWASIRRQDRETRTKKKPVSASSIQFTETELDADFESAFNSAVRSLACLKDCKPIIVDRKGGTIEARVRASIIDEAQEILVVIFRITNTRSGAIVWSESDAGMTVDMGKNLSNVNKIIAFLEGDCAGEESAESS